MKQLVISLGRLAVITCTALAIGTIVAKKYHQDYWHGTIKRVQTVDFNILAHTLPTKLSYTLINQDLVELQRTINSNYGLFGIVVTDCLSIDTECPHQKILYSSDSQHDWKQQLNSETLFNAPYSILRNPPPLLAEGGFDSSYDETWNSTKKLNKGKIIGRVYYVRGIAPKFSVKLRDWLKKLPYSLATDHGANKYYVLTFGIFLVGGLATSAGIELILYRRRVHERVKEQALFEANKLRQKLTKTEQEVSALIIQKELILTESENLQRKTQENAQKLEDEISQIKVKLRQSKQKYEQELAAELRNKAKTEEKLQSQKQIISELQQRQQENFQFSAQVEAELTVAQSQLEQLQQELSEQTECLTKLQKDNASSEEASLQEISIKEQSLVRVKQELSAAQAKNKQQKDTIEKLRSDKGIIEQKNYQLNKKLESNIKSSKKAIQKLRKELREQEIEHKNQEDFLKMFEEENNDLIVQLNEKISEIESLKSKYQDCNNNFYDLKVKIETYQQPEIKILDLSSKSLAFIGGYQEVRTRIIQDLCNDFNLTRFIEIPPSWERRMNLSNVRLRIRDAHFIFHLTAVNKHDSQNILRKIKHNISGKTIPINSKGYSGALREILEYLALQK